jgi:hypothetical protein
MVASLIFRRRRASPALFGSQESEFFADATITVIGDVATTDVGGTDYSWEVEAAGPGAPAGKLGVINDVAVFTYLSVNYRFQVSGGGAGSAAIAVTDDTATITIGAEDIEWEVHES